MAAEPSTQTVTTLDQEMAADNKYTIYSDKNLSMKNKTPTNQVSQKHKYLIPADYTQSLPPFPGKVPGITGSEASATLHCRQIDLDVVNEN